MPVLSVDYFFGIQARQYALTNSSAEQPGQQRGSQPERAGVDLGAQLSKVKQAELKLQQARNDSALRSGAAGQLNAFYLEANVASSQMRPQALAGHVR